MHQGNRDFGINTIKTRKQHACYGMGLGIIVLDDACPGLCGHTGIYVELVAGTVYPAGDRPPKNGGYRLCPKAIFDRHPSTKCGDRSGQ